MSTEPSINSRHDQLQAVSAAVSKAVIGQKDVIEHVLVAIIAGGHTLLEGVPGLGKTLLARAFS